MVEWQADAARQFLAPDSTEDMTVVLSASDTGDNYMLDRIFFENWYGMWHDGIVSNGGKFDLIQLLSVSGPEKRWRSTG